jgi:glycine oxidase
VQTAKRRIPTQTVIITAGAWSSALLEQAGVQVKVEPVRGQMLVYKTKPGLIKPMILHQGHYLIPRRDGRVLIGSTLEYVGYNKMVTQEAREALNDYALTLMPVLSSYKIEKHWSGLRPGSPSGVPYVGSHPDIEGLFFNCGHFRYGVILGLATVHLMVDLMQGRGPDIDPAPYALTAEH